MSMSSYHVICTTTVVAVVIYFADCRDDSYVRQSYNNNWPKLPTWENNQKNGTTPWPQTGYSPANTYNSRNANAPVWVRHNGGQVTSLQNQSQNHYVDSGSQSGLNHQEKEQVEPVVPSSSEVTDPELRDFSEELLTKDTSNNAANYVTINVQGTTTSRSDRDEAPLPLLTVDKNALKLPSISKLQPLYNNYVLESNVKEDHTPQEKQEEQNFLDSIVNSPVMQYTRNFLIQKGRIGSDPREFKDVLREIWFNMYPRGGRKVGSSGFEHVFLAEIKRDQVSGLHNWLYFDQQEQNHQANYLGYMKKLDLGDKGAILKFHFTFHGLDKPVDSMFIGTSPEFEMALYTTCFLLRADKVCPLKLNGHRFIIRTYTYRYGRQNMIGSAFPEI